MALPTTDLCDRYSDELQIAEPLFSDFGGELEFEGPIATVKCFEDNSKVREMLQTQGQGRVLVIDGGASDRCALLGDRMAQLAIDNDWAGIVVYGCVRDAADLGEMELPVKALNTHPKKSYKRDEGLTEVPVQFAGVTFTPGDWIYGDLDGLVVSSRELVL